MPPRSCNKTLVQRIQEALADAPPPAMHEKEIIEQRQKEIVAACLIGEAGGESVQGMQAIMNVIVNRSNQDAHQFAATVLRPKQFSMFNAATATGQVDEVKLNGIVARCKKHPLWQQALMLVTKAATGHLQDTTSGAHFYYAPARLTKPPSWVAKMVQTAKIGNHLFFKQVRK